MAAKSTFDRAMTGFAWRELDSIRVQGRDEPVGIYEPLARHGEETPEQKVVAAAYGHALACWRRRDFAGAIAALAPIAAADPPSAILLQRAKKFLAHPPAPDWDAVNTLEGKWRCNSNVIASGAKQSRIKQSEFWIASSPFGLLAMTRLTPRSLRAGAWSPADRTR